MPLAAEQIRFLSRCIGSVNLRLHTYNNCDEQLANKAETRGWLMFICTFGKMWRKILKHAMHVTVLRAWENRLAQCLSLG